MRGSKMSLLAKISARIDKTRIKVAVIEKAPCLSRSLDC